MHKRKQTYPSIKEFWESTEPKEFKLACDDQSDWKKFKRWLKRELDHINERDDFV